MPTFSLIAVAAGALSALCYASVISGAIAAVAVAYFAPLPLFAVGLSDGVRGAAIASVIASVLLASFGHPVSGLVYFLSEGLPVTILVGVALAARARGGKAEWPGAGTLIAALVGLAIALVLVAAVAAAIYGNGLAAEGRAAIEAMMAIVTPAGAPPQPALTDAAVAALTAAISVSWMTMMILNAALAQGVLVRTGRNRRPTPPFVRAVAPEWLNLAFVAGVVLDWVGPGSLGFLGRVVSLTVAMGFALIGLAVVHTLAHRVLNRRIVLAGFYMTLALAPFLGLILALIGFIEPWLRLRERFGPGATGGGNAGHST